MIFLLSNNPLSIPVSIFYAQRFEFTLILVIPNYHLSGESCKFYNKYAQFNGINIIYFSPKLYSIFLNKKLFRYLFIFALRFFGCHILLTTPVINYFNCLKTLIDPNKITFIGDGFGNRVNESHFESDHKNYAKSLGSYQKSFEFVSKANSFFLTSKSSSASGNNKLFPTENYFSLWSNFSSFCSSYKSFVFKSIGINSLHFLPHGQHILYKKIDIIMLLPEAYVESGRIDYSKLRLNLDKFISNLPSSSLLCLKLHPRSSPATRNLYISMLNKYNISFKEINSQIPSDFIYFTFSSFFPHLNFLIYYGKHFFWEEIFDNPTIINLRQLLISQ